MNPINIIPTIRYALTEQAKKLGIQFAPPRDGDAGYDLYCANPEPIVVHRHSVCTAILTGVHLEIPAQYVGIIKDRSSMGSMGWTIFGGVIDSSYRGELRIIFFNGSQTDQLIKPKQKIAQLLIVPTLTTQTAEMPLDALTKTERGAGGFGSTGQ